MNRRTEVPKTSKPVITGSLHPATPQGFADTVAEANRMWVEGYDLVGLFKLEKKLAATYRLRRVESHKTYASFADDGDNPMDMIL